MSDDAPDLRCDKCGITYMSVHYADNHFRRIAAGMKCVEAYIFKVCDGTLTPVEEDRDENHIQPKE